MTYETCTGIFINKYIRMENKMAAFVLLMLFALSEEAVGEFCLQKYGYSYYFYTYCDTGCCGYYYREYCCDTLTVGTIVGIVIGCLVAIGVIICVIVCICAHKNHKRTGVVVSNTTTQPRSTVAVVHLPSNQYGQPPPPQPYPYSYPPTYETNTTQAYPPGGVYPPPQPGTSDPAYPPPPTVTQPPAYDSLPQKS